MFAPAMLKSFRRLWDERRLSQRDRATLCVSTEKNQFKRYDRNRAILTADWCAAVGDTACIREGMH